MQFLSQQAKVLQEMDEEFGVTNLVEREFAQEKRVCDHLPNLLFPSSPVSIRFSTKMIF